MNQKVAKRIPKHILKWIKMVEEILNKQHVPIKDRWIKYSDNGKIVEVKIS